MECKIWYSYTICRTKYQYITRNTWNLPKRVLVIEFICKCLEHIRGIYSNKHLSLTTSIVYLGQWINSQTLTIRLMINACQKWLQAETKAKNIINFKNNNNTARIIWRKFIQSKSKVLNITLSKFSESEFETRTKE